MEISLIWLIKIILIPGIGSLLDRIIMHPLDNVLSLQQKEKLTIWQAIKQMSHEFGVGKIYKSFYKGFLIPFITVAPAKLIVISFYYNFDDFLRQSFYVPHWQSYLTSAIAASFIDLLLTCPAENYRVKKVFGINFQPSAKHLYHGSLPLLFRSLAGNIIMFAGSSTLVEYKITHSAFLAAFICCFIYQFVTIPIESWKNNVMSDKHFDSIWSHLNSVIDPEKMFKGVGIKMIATFAGAFIIGLMMTLNANIDDILGIE